MAIWYVDLLNGSPVGAANSFASRTNSIPAIAGSVSAGDQIRVMASPAIINTGLNANWAYAYVAEENTSVILITSSGSPFNTSLWQPVSSEWQTVAFSGTAMGQSTSTFKSSETSPVIITTSGFTPRKLAFCAFVPVTGPFSGSGPYDLSAYQQISIWLQHNLNSLSGISSTPWSLALCSDGYGNTIVDQFNIPIYTDGTHTYPAANTWFPYVFNNMGPLGSSIGSIAIYQNDSSISTAYDLTLGGIVASLPASSNAAITLGSLISTNIPGDTWHNVNFMYTNGASSFISLDGNVNSQPSFFDGYPTGLYLPEPFPAQSIPAFNQSPYTNAIYRREPILMVNTASTIDYANTNPFDVDLSFGWDRTSMSTQSDETWIDGRGCAIGPEYQVIRLSNLGLIRFGSSIALTLQHGASDSIVDLAGVSGCNTVGIATVSDSTSASTITFTGIRGNQKNGSDNLQIGTKSQVDLFNIQNNNFSGGYNLNFQTASVVLATSVTSILGQSGSINYQGLSFSGDHIYTCSNWLAPAGIAVGTNNTTLSGVSIFNGITPVDLTNFYCQDITLSNGFGHQIRGGGGWCGNTTSPTALFRYVSNKASAYLYGIAPYTNFSYDALLGGFTLPVGGDGFGDQFDIWCQNASGIDGFHYRVSGSNINLSLPNVSNTVFNPCALTRSEMGLNRHTQSGIAWAASVGGAKLIQTEVGNYFSPSTYKTFIPLDPLVVTGPATCTVKAFVMMNDPTTTCRIRVPANFIAGVTEDVCAYAVGAGDYEQIVISFTTTGAGTFPVYFECWGTVLGWCYVDDMSYTVVA